MLSTYDFNEYETVVEHHVCDFHKDFPTEIYAGCTCSGSIGKRRKKKEPTRDQEIEPLEKSNFDPTIYLPEKI